MFSKKYLNTMINIRHCSTVCTVSQMFLLIHVYSSNLWVQYVKPKNKSIGKIYQILLHLILAKKNHVSPSNIAHFES